MHVRCKYPCNFVGRAAHENMYWIGVFRICLARSDALSRVYEVINEGTNVNISPCIREMKRGRRREWALAVLSREVIRSKEAGEQNEALKRRQQHQRPQEFLLMCQLITPLVSEDRLQRASGPQKGFPRPRKRTRASRLPSRCKHPSPESPQLIAGRYRAS